jgi:ribonuclease HI
MYIIHTHSNYSTPGNASPRTQEQRTLTHVKPGKSNQTIPAIYTTKHRLHHTIHSTSLVEATSHHRNIAGVQGQSSRGSPKTAAPDSNRRPDNIHRQIWPQWAHWGGNILPHNKGEYIGIDDTHNVYAAELTAIQMAVTLFREMMDNYRNVHIFTDNHFAIQAVDIPKRQCGQCIIEEILDTIDEVHKLAPTCTIHIEWVSGHKNIEGNEQAEQTAKTTANLGTTSPNAIMRSAQRRSIQSMARTKWENEWKTGRQNAKRLRSMSQYPGTTTRPELY